MALQLKPRQPVEDEVENWDDDDFMIDDDLTFRSASTATTTNQPHRRDSNVSFRSERESLFGDEDRQVHLAGEDEKSTLDAISAAQHAGIPIPQNVPPSALIGGTIKRLGGRKIKKVISEDWGDDIILPKNGQALRIKPQDASQFPETLRQVSGSLTTSPMKLMSPPIIHRSPQKEHKPRLSAASTLDRFRDNDDDDDVFGDGSETIKATKVTHKPISLITPPTPSKKEEDDDFEMDLELPSSGKLKLTSRRDIPRTPNINTDVDFDWGEGSLGTRFGGTRRDGFSNRSSSASAMSPSIASSMTAESEDDAFDGLILPVGPLDLGERLKLRKQSRSPSRPPSADRRPRSAKQNVPQTPITEREKEDLLDGLDVDDGDIFSSGKLSLHRNVKVKETRQNSPARPKAAVSLTFTNKPVASQPSRLPRPAGTSHHERSHTQSSLEPVSESGGPIPYRPSRRSQSRMGHSSRDSTSSIGGPITPSSATFQSSTTPRRRELGQKSSLGALRTEPSTSNASLLRLKRSLPVMKPAESPARPLSSRYERPPSRTELHRTSLQGTFRPKTPVDRTQPAPAYQGSAAQARKPFLPAGSSSSQSHHVAAKNPRMLRRHDSDFGPETRPLSRAFSRSTMRSPSPRKHRHVPSMEKVAAEPWQTLSKPRRVKQFGDGTELDAFDDLPTSAQTESKFTKLPTASRDRNTLRNKFHQHVLPERSTPSPVSPFTPARTDYQPHFARDTAASRKAREVSLAQRAPPPTTPVAPLPSQRVAQLSTRTPLNPHGSVRSKKRKPPQLKPHLITNMSSAKESKVVNGMTYNPETCRWEGNETALHAFDVPVSTPMTASLPAHVSRENQNTTPRPYLITNMGASTGVKREGNMVFDPTHMRWLEVAGPGDDILDGFSGLEDEDPFKDIPDLEDRETEKGEKGNGRVSDVGSEWLVGEEFDVGPEFIRRQRDEEERWRKKCERWVNTTERNNNAWRWALRDIVQGP